MGVFKGAKGAIPPTNLAPNKFQERPPGASGIQGNLSAAGAPPRTLLDELAALSQAHSWLVSKFIKQTGSYTAE